MKIPRKATGLHIVSLVISLILLFNGFLFYFPLNKPVQNPITTFPLNTPGRAHTLTNLPFTGNIQFLENQSSPLAQLTWMQQHIWPNLNSRNQFTLTVTQGQLSRETLHFSNIQPEPIQIAVEDYNPVNCPFEDYIWTDEESYMGFRINGTQPVRVDGFWIYLRGESQGIFRYRVYGAEPGTQADTFVDTSAPFTDWIEVPVSPMLEPGEEYWFWIDTNESALVLNPLSTYAHTFYFGLGRAFGATTDTRINWVYCRDDVNPDEEDEGDCYGHFNSWSYRTRDLFLNVSILPESSELFPSAINLRLNGHPVANQEAPSNGVWASDEYQPPVLLDGAPRLYQILLSWPNFYQWSINFDVRWVGNFIDMVPVSSGPTSVQLEANWLLTIIVDFPTGVENQTISVPLLPNSTIEFLHRNTLLYTDWVVDGDFLIINNAEDGIWHVYCMIPVSPLSFYWWVLLSIIVVLLLLISVVFAFYRQQILLPRQRSHQRKLQTLVDSFYDIHKIRRILLIHKETGLCLLDPIIDRKMKANLVSALIQAITAFGVNLTETDESPEPLDDTSSLQQITYRDFHIIVHDGQYTRNALIFKQPPSGQLGKRLEEFTEQFEQQYQDVFENWAGRLNIFSEGIDLVDEYFFISLRVPNMLQADLAQTLSLSSSERRLYALAKTLTDKKSCFFIKALVDQYLAKKGVESLEVFDVLFSLRNKGVIIPCQTEIPFELNNAPSS